MISFCSRAESHGRREQAAVLFVRDFLGEEDVAAAVVLTRVTASMGGSPQPSEVCWAYRLDSSGKLGSTKQSFLPELVFYPGLY